MKRSSKYPLNLKIQEDVNIHLVFLRTMKMKTEKFPEKVDKNLRNFMMCL